jgi:DNA-binding NtrC family response regulator
MNQTKSSAGNPDPDDRQVVFAVDDEPMLLELVTLVLEPFGYRVRTFHNPDTAVRAYTLANPPPALIITDYAMHNMTGMDLIRDCRRVNPKQKIIMVSGTVDETIYHNSPVKPNRFLAKPYQARQLSDLVKEVLAEK